MLFSAYIKVLLDKGKKNKPTWGALGGGWDEKGREPVELLFVKGKGATGQINHDVSSVRTSAKIVLGLRILLDT